MAHLAILLPVPFLAAPAGLLIDGSEGGLPVVRGWTVSSAVHLSALKKLQKDHILLYIDSLYNRLFHAITNYDWKVLDYQKKKRVIMSSLSRSLSPITTPSGFSCTRAWAVGHTSPESGWPVWRRAPTRPGCCPRNGAGECQTSWTSLTNRFQGDWTWNVMKWDQCLVSWLNDCYLTLRNIMKWISKIYLNQHNCPAKKVEPGEPAIASAGLSVERAQQPLQPAVTVIRGI